MSSLAVRKAAPAAGRPAPRARPSTAIALVPTLTLLLGALYCLLPVAWVLIAATESGRRAVLDLHVPAGLRLHAERQGPQRLPRRDLLEVDEPVRPLRGPRRPPVDSHLSSGLTATPSQYTASAAAKPSSAS